MCAKACRTFPLSLLLAAGTLNAQPGGGPADAESIMARAAANVEQSEEGRLRYVYRQTVHSTLVRSNGQLARKEDRQYSVIPTGKTTEKRLDSFRGQYRKGKEMLPYSEPGFTYKDMDIDGELINELTDDLVNDSDSRDGIPHELFPLRTRDLADYKFSHNGHTQYRGRRVHKIAFEPRQKRSCITIGGDDECSSRPWKGEAWIDAEDLQPARIYSQLAVKVPWAVRVFLGTNLRQTGFSVSYQRIAENVWFPVSYGTEFRLDALWFYKLTITLSLESMDFQITGATSSIHYDLPRP
jgi:hypothetical protein